MGREEFEREVIDRLARIEVKQDLTCNSVYNHAKIIDQQGKDIVSVDARARSAHHRINGIFAAAGVVGAVAGWFAQFVASLWPKAGGGN